MRASFVASLLDRSRAAGRTSFALTTDGQPLDGQRDFLEDASQPTVGVEVWPRPQVPILVVPWEKEQDALFDFDMVCVGDVDDEMIERFAAALTADADKTRSSKLGELAICVMYPERLSANSINILQRLSSLQPKDGVFCKLAATAIKAFFQDSAKP
jgi:hypothetical protein